tara:strand:+ start:48624 stop:49382 length:759 start_codon:yes stop_codon:yes gene_type:complete
MMNTYKVRSLTMKKMQNYIPLSMLVVGAFATQTGCVDAGETLRILRNQAPDPNCEVPTGEEASFLSSGIIDVAASSGYIFTPLVESRAVEDDATDRRTFLDGAVVKLKFADEFFDAGTLTRLEEEGLSYFTQPFTGSIASNSTAALKFEIVPKRLLEEMQANLGDGEITRITAEIELRGSIDGGDVNSPTYNYPIEVCNGCLSNDLGLCADLATDEIRTGGACQEKQDGVVDCCTDAVGEQVCPAVAPDLEQ